MTVRPASPKDLACGSTISKSPSTRILPLLLMVIFVEGIPPPGRKWRRTANHSGRIEKVRTGTSWPRSRSIANRLRPNNFAQRACHHVVCVSAHLSLPGHERIFSDAQNQVRDVLVNVAEGVETQMRRITPGFRGKPPAKFFVGDGHQAALRVLNYRHGARAEQLRGENQRTNRVVGGNAAGVSNH